MHYNDDSFLGKVKLFTLLIIMLVMYPFVWLYERITGHKW